MNKAIWLDTSMPLIYCDKITINLFSLFFFVTLLICLDYSSRKLQYYNGNF